MDSVVGRLFTFSSWLHAVSPCRLSSLGFYYSGRDDVVTCSACSAEIDGCSSVDEVVEKHRVQSPNCAGVASSSETSSTKTVADSVRTVSRGTTNAFASGKTVTDIVQYRQTGVADRSSALTEPCLGTLYRSNPDFDRLRSERVRLDTFHDWPPRAARVVDPRDLVEAGLFYTGQRDRVQCAFCRGFLRNWISGDRPADEHRKHFPDCPFVRGLDVGNVRYVETEATGNEHGDVRFSTTSSQVFRADSNAQSLPIAAAFDLVETSPVSRDSTIIRGPKHPQFADEKSRIRSFDGKRVGRGQTSEGLAKAGFFHVGPEDNVRCFQCDGGLKNWRPTDDPWTEHTRWFPRCPFLLAHRDQTFIKYAQMPTNEVKNLTFAHTSASSGRIHVEMSEIEARMDSATVQAVIDMGYSRELVRQVIERRLTTAGEDFPNTQGLLDDIFETEDDPSLQRYSSDAGSYNSFTTSSLRSTHAFQSTASTPIVLSRSEIPRAPTPSDQQSLSSLDILRHETPDQASTPRVSSRSEVPRAPTPSDQRSLSSLDNVRLETPDQDVERTLEENRRLREARTCSVCMDKEVNTVFLPCGHLVCCNECSQSLTNCAVCRALVRGTVKIFLS